MVRDFDNLDELAQFLKHHSVDAGLLCDFIEEAIESESAYKSLTKRIQRKSGDTSFTREFMDNLKLFCQLLGKIKKKDSESLNKIYSSEAERRTAMMATVDKFLAVLQDET